MTGSNRSKLPRGLYLRGTTIYISYVDESGRQRARSSGCRIDEVDKAVALRQIMLEKIEARKAGADALRSVRSLASVTQWWLELRQRRQKQAWRDDESRLRLHVLPVLGHRDIDEITPADLEGLFLELRSKPLPSTGKRPAPKTIWNTYAALRALYRDAKKKGKAQNNPCILGEEELGPIEDADPDWRRNAIFSRPECAMLLFDPRLTVDRRTLYAVTYLAGLRVGEVCGLRVGDFDRMRQPLAALTVARQYEGRRTKTRVVKEMPVHPVLHHILARWLDDEWPCMFGHAPKPGDLVFPRLPDDPPSIRGEVRDKNYERRRRGQDFTTLGIGHRRGHDLRTSFITHALSDGADPTVLERLTHPSSGKSSAFAGYRRLLWPDACSAVAALSIDPPVAVMIATAVGADSAPPTDDSGQGSPGPMSPTTGSIPPTPVCAPTTTTPTTTIKKNPRDSQGFHGGGAGSRNRIRGPEETQTSRAVGRQVPVFVAEALGAPLLGSAGL